MKENFKLFNRNFKISKADIYEFLILALIAAAINMLIFLFR